MSHNFDLVENRLRHGACPLCGSTDIRKRGAISYRQPIKFSTVAVSLAEIPELWVCTTCKSGFVQNVIPEGVAREFYTCGESAQRWSRAVFAEQKTAEVLRLLSQFLRPGLNVLDIGCNTGELLDFAKQKGCKTTGIEYSVVSHAFLKEKGHAYAEELSVVPDESFDVITAFDLIEHLYHVKEFLALCQRKLKANGYLILLTGDITCRSAAITGPMWWYCRYPEHIVFPSLWFFEKHSGFSVKRWLRTYASIEYRCNYLKMTVRVARAVIRRTYDGLPSMGPDHALIVLQK